MAADYAAALRQLADMGYRYIESRSYGPTPKAYRKLLQSLGLKAIAGGSSLKELQTKTADFIATGQALGYRYLSCYWPWLSSADNLTRDECLRSAEHLNQLGETFRREGLRLVWHNHDKEFAKIGEQTAFELLMDNIDPRLVGTQLDLYWVTKGGGDPIRCFEQYPGRFELVHVKDMVPTEDRGMTCPGSGRIDFGGIFKHARRAGIRYAIVEEEQGSEGMVCARNSLKYLKSVL